MDNDNIPSESDFGSISATDLAAQPQGVGKSRTLTSNMTIIGLLMIISGLLLFVYMLTHEAKESSLQKALNQIDRLDVLRHKTMVIRIEDKILQSQ